MDSTGAVTDRYDYEAFGDVVSQGGTTSNVYLYSGEQDDANLGLTYLRARYLNRDRGRFSTADPLEGEPDDPLSLNRYLYAEGDAADKIDPTGELATIQETVEGLTIDSVIEQQFLQSLAANALLGKVVLAKVKGEDLQDQPVIAFQYMTSPKLVFVGLTGFVPTGYDKNCSQFIVSNICAFFTPDVYNSSIVAQNLLARPKRPAFRVELTLYKKHDGVTPLPAAPVAPEGPPDRPFLMPGGRLQFVTPGPIPFWTRRLDVTAIN